MGHQALAEKNNQEASSRWANTWTRLARACRLAKMVGSPGAKPLELTGIDVVSNSLGELCVSLGEAASPGGKGVSPGAELWTAGLEQNSDNALGERGTSLGEKWCAWR